MAHRGEKFAFETAGLSASATLTFNSREWRSASFHAREPGQIGARRVQIPVIWLNERASP